MAGLFLVLKIILLIIGAGVILSILFYIPLTIYVFPYLMWVGCQNNIGKHKDKRNESIRQTAKNATKLYKCWILRKKPTF